MQLKNVKPFIDAVIDLLGHRAPEVESAGKDDHVIVVIPSGLYALELSFYHDDTDGGSDEIKARLVPNLDWYGRPNPEPLEMREMDSRSTAMSIKGMLQTIIHAEQESNYNDVLDQIMDTSQPQRRTT